MPACKTMVCVTRQKTCERLIHEGAKIAADAGLTVVHITHAGGTFLGEARENEALEYLFRISRNYGADMDVIRAADVVNTIVDYAKKNEIKCIVMGMSGDRNSMDFAQTLRYRLPGVEVHVIMP